MGFLLSSRTQIGAFEEVLTGRTEESSLVGREARAATLHSVGSVWGIRTMKQQMRCGGEAPGRLTHSRYGMKAMRLLGHRHLGRLSADPQARR